MKRIAAISTLVVALGMLLLWRFGGTSVARSIGLMAAVGLGVLVLAAVVVLWWRHRRHRQMLDMRDSALW